jgi:hypothetical protein
MKPPGTNAGSGSISRLGPHFADRRPRIPRPALHNVSITQNSNRECQRLETAVTRRKERTRTGSNRELAAYFSPPKLDRTSGSRRRAGLLRPRFGTGCWVGAKGENSTATAGGEHPMPSREGGEPLPYEEKEEKNAYSLPQIL